MCGAWPDTSEDPVEAAHFVHFQGTTGPSDADYIASAWTLQWFERTKTPRLTDAHYDRFHQLLNLIADASASDTANKISARCGRILGGDRYYCVTVFETLALAGVLAVPSMPGLLQKWTSWSERPRVSGETIAPAAFWRRLDGIDPRVFKRLFPKCTLPAKRVTGEKL